MPYPNFASIEARQSSLEWGPIPDPTLTPKYFGPLMWVDGLESTISYTTDNDIVILTEDGGRNFIQRTAGLHPSFRDGTNLINGQAAFRFDDTEYITYDAGSNAISLTAFSMFVVAKLDTTADTNGRIWSTRRQTTGANDLTAPNNALYRPGADTLRLVLNGVAISTDVTYVDDTVFLYEAWYDGTTASHRMNGGTIYSTAITYGLDFRFMRLGDSCESTGTPPDAGSNNMRGSIAEFVIIDHAISDVSRTAIRSYLNSKWDVY